MAFWHTDTLQLAQFRPGITSKAEIGKGLIMVCMEIGANQADTGHDHPFDQCGMVIEGQIEMFIGGEHSILTAHDSYFIPAGIRHGWKTFAGPVKLFDICQMQTTA